MILKKTLKTFVSKSNFKKTTHKMSRFYTLDSNTNFMWFFLFKVVEDGYEFFAKRQLVTLFSAPNYCGEFDNAGGMMSVDETLMCSFQVSFFGFWC